MTTCRASFTHPDFATLVDPPFAAHKEGKGYFLLNLMALRLRQNEGGENLCSFVKAVEGAPDGALVFIELALRLGYCLGFGDVAGLYLRLYPKIDLAVEEYFVGDEAGFVHGRENTFIKKGVGGGDVHFLVSSN